MVKPFIQVVLAEVVAIGWLLLFRLDRGLLHPN